MPQGDESGAMYGFQLWANLPAANKMMTPRYRGVTSAEIPSVTDPSGATIKVIAGTAGGVFLSTDNGASWSPRNNGLLIGAARTVAAQGNTFVTAIYDENNLGSRGVFISNDSGMTWTPYGAGLNPLAVRTLAFHGGHLLAGTEAHSILSTQPTAPLELMTAVSRKTHGGAGVFDLTLPLSGTPAVECRSGALGHTLIVTFSNNVVSGNATDSQGTATAAPSSFSGNTMTIPLTNVADAQTVRVDLANVTDTFGQVLPGGSVQVGSLAGDANGDRIVNTGDTLQTRSRSGVTLDASTYRSDLNADGVINSGDALVVRSRSGNSLP